jgi:peptidoglycan/LPS O-acetylase OafA/YrhL
MTSPAPPTLQACLEGKRNNLDLLRFVAAAGVIASHAFPLGEGVGTREPLEVFTHGQLTLGRLCVAVFLIISGVLIVRSWERQPDAARFLWARALRIFPGLLVALLLSAFVLGPLFTERPLTEYLSTPSTFLYVLRNITLRAPQWELPGVFAANPYPNAVNGSLWTLQFEVGFYLLVLGLGLAGWVNRWMALAGWMLAAVASVLTGRLGLWPELYLYFGGGALLYLWRDRIRLSPWLALACVAVWVATAWVGVGCRLATGVCGAYGVLCLAFVPAGRLADFGRRGDLSYGVYVYAFPVQQALTSLWGTRMAWWMNAALSFPVVVGLAALSWHWVEKPALSLKKSPPAPHRWLRARLRPGGMGGR